MLGTSVAAGNFGREGRRRRRRCRAPRSVPRRKLLAAPYGAMTRKSACGRAGRAARLRADPSRRFARSGRDERPGPSGPRRRSRTRRALIATSARVPERHRVDAGRLEDDAPEGARPPRRSRSSGTGRCRTRPAGCARRRSSASASASGIAGERKSQVREPASMSATVPRERPSSTAPPTVPTRHYAEVRSRRTRDRRDGAAPRGPPHANPTGGQECEGRADRLCIEAALASKSGRKRTNASGREADEEEEQAHAEQSECRSSAIARELWSGPELDSPRGSADGDRPDGRRPDRRRRLGGRRRRASAELTDVARVKMRRPRPRGARRAREPRAHLRRQHRLRPLRRGRSPRS